MSSTILVINPGSTSTKLALYDGKNETECLTIEHRADNLGRFEKIIDQKGFRTLVMETFLLTRMVIQADAVIGRGGLLRPVPGGVYEVNEAMLEDLSSGRFGEHASNLGAILAHEAARSLNCRAYIADPVVIDEMTDEAHLSGLKDLPRRSIFHALNQKSSARKAADELHINYEESSFIVAHMGGGISVGAHRRGRVIDVNNALDGEGPFSPERSGTLPAGELARLCFSGDYTLYDIKKKITGMGGIVDYLGSNNVKAAMEAREAGNEEADLVIRALIHQVSKEIASHGATLEGKVDGIVLTGGLAQSSFITNEIKRKTAYLAPVIIIPGEREMEALAENAHRVLTGEITPLEY